MAIISRNTKRNFCKKRKTSYLCSPDFSESVTGEMLEWLKRHAWKACKPQKGFRSSNLRLSANNCLNIKQTAKQQQQCVPNKKNTIAALFCTYLHNVAQI